MMNGTGTCASHAIRRATGGLAAAKRVAMCLRMATMNGALTLAVLSGFLASPHPAAGSASPLQAPAASTLPLATAGTAPPRPQPPRVLAPAARPPAATAPPAARCTPPSGDPISAEQILTDLSQGKNVDLQGKIIDGGLDVDAVFPVTTGERKSSLRVIRGRLRLDSCRVTGRISFPRCLLVEDVLFIGAFNGRDASFGKSLNLSSVRVAGAADLTGSSVGGDIYVSDLSLDTDLLLPRSSEGPVVLNDVTVGRNFGLSGGQLH